jgi:PAS domain S-box-containing protein
MHAATWTNRGLRRAAAWASLILTGMVALGIALSWAVPDQFTERPAPWESVLVWLVLAAVPVWALYLWRREVALQRSAQLERAERRLSAHAETGDDLLWEMDSGGKLSYFGPNVRDYLGYTPEELVGRHTDVILPPWERERTAKLLSTSKSQGSGWTEEPFTFVTKDGQEQRFLSSGVAHVGAKGDVLGFTGTVRLLDPGDDEARALEDKKLRIADVLGRRALRMVFQPIADVATGTIIGAEALARFPDDPTQSPDRWFADAADVGLSTELELLAIEIALEAATGLPPHLYLSVNVSPHTVCTDRLSELLSSSSRRPTELVVEITEHVSVEDYSALERCLERLRALGLRLAVDDAGAGYASFRHILGLSPDYIKLDRALIDGMDGDPARRALVSAVVTFGREVSAAVVAEGIETPGELRTARLLDVDAAQGFLIGRPEAAGPEWALHPSRSD